MSDMIKSYLRFIGSYKALFILWLALGTVTLIAGDISRITYFCVWFLLLIEYAARALDGK